MEKVFDWVAKVLCVGLVSIMLPMASQAVAQQSSVGAGLSIFGPIVEGSYRVQPKFGVRATAYGLGISIDRTIDVDSDYTVDGAANFSNFGVLADYYPMSGKWRVSGGLFFSSDIISGTFTSPTKTDFNGTLGFDKSTALMLTTGWNWTVAKRMHLGLDLGLIASPLKVTTDSTDPTVKSDVASINSDLSSVGALPYVGATIGFSF